MRASAFALNLLVNLFLFRIIVFYRLTNKTLSAHLLPRNREGQMSTTEKITAPKSVWELIDKIGGRRLANHLGGIAFSTVQSWKTRGIIPVEHWISIIGLCSVLNIPGVDPVVLTLWHTSPVSTPSDGQED